MREIVRSSHIAYRTSAEGAPCGEPLPVIKLQFRDESATTPVYIPEHAGKLRNSLGELQLRTKGLFAGMQQRIQKED